MKMYLLFPLISIFLLSCGTKSLPEGDESMPISHQAWSDLLQKHVDAEGNVNYEGFLQDRTELQAYLQLLQENPPASEQSEEAQLAYWINVYNAFTVELILEHWPLESIKDISNLNIPFVSSPWDIKLIKIKGKKYDLNNIEHSILRKKFDEPRIHFAINCASESCPLLRNEAYTETQLESQLQEQAIAFVNDTTKNKLGEEQVELSKIFSWFKGDFTQDASLIEFLNQYAKKEIPAEAEISHLEYDWGLND